MMRRPGKAFANSSLPDQWSWCQCELIRARTGLGVSLRISAITARAVTARVQLSKTTTSSSLTTTTVLVEVQYVEVLRGAEDVDAVAEVFLDQHGLGAGDGGFERGGEGGRRGGEAQGGDEKSSRRKRHDYSYGAGRGGLRTIVGESR